MKEVDYKPTEARILMHHELPGSLESNTRRYMILDEAHISKVFGDAIKKTLDEAICPQCNGTGRRFRNKCQPCKGSGIGPFNMEHRKGFRSRRKA